MSRNIHQRRVKKHKATLEVKPIVPVVEQATPDPAQPAPVVPVATTIRHAGAPVKGGMSQEVMDARVAELPWELKRIALFSACVVILLVILWFVLR